MDISGELDCDGAESAESQDEDTRIYQEKHANPHLISAWHQVKGQNPAMRTGREEVEQIKL